MAGVGFIGRYEHSLDAKGRVILPVKFRASFDGGGYLSRYHEGCIALWTQDEFERQLQVMKESAEQGREQRNLVRAWSGSAADVEIDKSGRMPIPSYLRSAAGLTSEVLLIGAIDRIELWSPEVYADRVEPSEQQWVDA